MDAVAYIRVSTNKEEQELSLENQREFFEKYVGNRNDTLIRIYSDKGKSATKMKNRKNLQRTHRSGKQTKYGSQWLDLVQHWCFFWELRQEWPADIFQE